MSIKIVSFKSEADWIMAYRVAGALHVPEASAVDPLVHLGKREKATFDGSSLAKNESLVRMSVCDLIAKCLNIDEEILAVTRVIGTEPLVTLTASHIAYLKNRSTAPKETQGDCRALSFEHMAQVRPGEVVLIVEDSFTTGRLPVLADEIARAAGATVLPFVLTLVNLSGREASSGKKVVSLVSDLLREYAC